MLHIDMTSTVSKRKGNQKMVGSNGTSPLLRPVLTSLRPWAGGGQAGGIHKETPEQSFCSGSPSYLSAAETKSLHLILGGLLVRFHDFIEDGMLASLQRV